MPRGKKTKTSIAKNNRAIESLLGTFQIVGESVIAFDFLVGRARGSKNYYLTELVGNRAGNKLIMAMRLAWFTHGNRNQVVLMICDNLTGNNVANFQLVFGLRNKNKSIHIWSIVGGPPDPCPGVLGH